MSADLQFVLATLRATLLVFAVSTFGPLRGADTGIAINLNPGDQGCDRGDGLDAAWVPCGQLTLTEDGAELLASTFAYGLRYLERPNALEVDPVGSSNPDADPAIRPLLGEAGW